MTMQLSNKRKFTAGFGSSRNQNKPTLLMGFPLGLKFKRDSNEVNDANDVLKAKTNVKESALKSQDAMPNEDTVDKQGQKGSGRTTGDPFASVATFTFETSSSEEDEEEEPVNKMPKLENKNKFDSFFNFQ